MKFTEEHEALRKSVIGLIEEEINPHVEAWEREGVFPAKEVFKKFGEQGFLGVTKPTEYGGMGLDFSYSVVMAEAIAKIECGGVPLASVFKPICVHQPSQVLARTSSRKTI